MNIVNRFFFMTVVLVVWAVPTVDLLGVENLPPGVIVDSSPDFETVYIGSPSIAILSDGTYVASHDWFGKTKHHAMTVILASKDKGKTWEKLTEFQFYHGNLFALGEDLYLLGEFESLHGEREKYSHYAIRRSRDGGKTWTEPVDSKTGLLRTDGIFHTAPCPTIVLNGRIWRAIEDVMPPDEAKRLNRNHVEFGGRFRAIMTSAPVDSDLLDAANWTFSEPFVFDMEHWIGFGFLEGNAVVSPENTMLNVLRCSAEGREKAIILDVAPDGRRLRSRGVESQIDFTGGAVKFSIRFDPKSEKYWTISNKQTAPRATRNVLVLKCSKDLRHWEQRTVLFRHFDRRHHGWQYVDWQFDGDDMIFVSRTGWADSHNHHDANYMTFHRIENFRDTSAEDDAPWLGDAEQVSESTKKFDLSAVLRPGQTIRFGVLRNDAPALANRNYVWKNVPERFVEWKTVMNYGGDYNQFSLTAKEDIELYMIRPVVARTAILHEWTPIPTDDFHHTKPGGTTPMTVYRRTVKTGETVEFPHSLCFSGETIIFPND